jgi:uncharacterized membrane protein YgcG
MKPYAALIAFALLCIAQLAVPFSMIRQVERVLSEGQQVKLKCQPVDPADLFRGRYVWLAFEMGNARMPPGVPQPKETKRVFVTMEQGDDGFHRWGLIHEEAPAEALYVHTTVNPFWNMEGATVRVETPLDRFYLPEDLAPEAERLYFEGLRESPEDCYVTARVLDGIMVLEQLYLNGVPVLDYVRQQLALPPPAAAPAGLREGEDSEGSAYEGERGGEGEDGGDGEDGAGGGADGGRGGAGDTLQPVFAVEDISVGEDPI